MEYLCGRQKPKHFREFIYTSSFFAYIFYVMKINSLLIELKRLLLVSLGGALMAININTFVNSANLFPGGFSGLSLLIQKAVLNFSGIAIPFSVLMYSFNIIPVFIGFKFIGKKFTVYSVIMIFISGILTDFIPGLNITNDMLLCAVFGGIFGGISVSLCLFADSSSGGTDFIAIYIAEKSGKSAWNWILAFNICILITAGFLFGWPSALYSIIFQYVSTQTINFLYKKYAKTTLFIITDKEDEIYSVIKKRTNHAATVFQGKGCYAGNEHKMLYTVVSSQESGALEKAIRNVDPNAFINVIQSKEILGRFYKRSTD